jgi:hypothetical protein
MTPVCDKIYVSLSSVFNSQAFLMQQFLSLHWIKIPLWRLFRHWNVTQIRHYFNIALGWYEDVSWILSLSSCCSATMTILKSPKEVHGSTPSTYASNYYTRTYPCSVRPLFPASCLAILFRLTLVVIIFASDTRFVLAGISQSDGGQENSRQRVWSVEHRHPHHLWDSLPWP